MLERALRNIYEQNFQPMTDIERNLFHEFCRTFNRATDIGLSKAPHPDDDFRQALRHNNAVFAAFKTHRLQNDVARLLTDSNGNLKPFEQWKNDVQSITSHQCERWLRTEYDTAVLRARQAANWQQFLREADVLPNLKWIPSTSPNPGADHQPFWNTVLPIAHDFWNRHRPGDRWNCKCELRSTDEPPTAVPTTVSDGLLSGAAPHPGLDNNPGIDAKIFADSHPYIANAYEGAQEAVEKAVKEFLKTTPINAKDDKEVFYDMKENAAKQILQHEPVNMRGNQFYVKTMQFGKKEVSAILWHCFDEDEVNLAKELYCIIPVLTNGKYVPLDMSRKNYKTKIKEGVKHFVVYEIEYQGMIYELKCEAIKKRSWHRMVEFPYSLKKKR